MQKIETDRLFIRRFRESDAADLYEYLSDSEVVRFEPYDVFSMEDCVTEAASRAGNPAFWAVCLKDGGKLIGNIWLNEERPEFGTWELGYVFNAKFQGMGYATEACRAMLTHAFTSLRAHRVVARCDRANAPSWRLLERLNMRRESHRLKNVFFRRDDAGSPIWKDTYEYAVLAEEWTPRDDTNRREAE